MAHAEKIHGEWMVVYDIDPRETGYYGPFPNRAAAEKSAEHVSIKEQERADKRKADDEVHS